MSAAVEIEPHLQKNLCRKCGEIEAYHICHHNDYELCADDQYRSFFTNLLSTQEANIQIGKVSCQVTIGRELKPPINHSMLPSGLAWKICSSATGSDGLGPCKNLPWPKLLWCISAPTPRIRPSSVSGKKSYRTAETTDWWRWMRSGKPRRSERFTRKICGSFRSRSGHWKRMTHVTRVFRSWAS